MITEQQEEYYLDYVQIESYTEVAEKHDVNRSTVYRAVQKVKEGIERAEEVKRKRELMEEVADNV